MKYGISCYYVQLSTVHEISLRTLAADRKGRRIYFCSDIYFVPAKGITIWYPRLNVHQWLKNYELLLNTSLCNERCERLFFHSLLCVNNPRISFWLLKIWKLVYGSNYFKSSCMVDLVPQWALNSVRASRLTIRVEIVRSLHPARSLINSSRSQSPCTTSLPPNVTWNPKQNQKKSSFSRHQQLLTSMQKLETWTGRSESREKTPTARITAGQSSRMAATLIWTTRLQIIVSLVILRTATSIQWKVITLCPDPKTQVVHNITPRQSRGESLIVWQRIVHFASAHSISERTPRNAKARIATAIIWSSLVATGGFWMLSPPKLKHETL